MSDLTQKKCLPCEGGVPPLEPQAIANLLTDVDGWLLEDEQTAIFKNYSFKNFYHTMSFVNAVAFLANQENHHPDMSIGFNYCHLKLTTHAVNGLTENDFILAAKINKLL